MLSSKQGSRRPAVAPFSHWNRLRLETSPLSSKLCPFWLRTIRILTRKKTWFLWKWQWVSISQEVKQADITWEKQLPPENFGTKTRRSQLHSQVPDSLPRFSAWLRPLLWPRTGQPQTSHNGIFITLNQGYLMSSRAQEGTWTLTCVPECRKQISPVKDALPAPGKPRETIWWLKRSWAKELI